MRLQLKKKLSDSGWTRVLRDFIDSDEFYMLLTNLSRENSKTGITPTLKQVFNAFYECPYEDLKVVMIGQDPYPAPGVADGIAFSCSNTMKVQPSLRVMFKEIEDTVYPDGYEWNPDLRRWTQQGVLMLNTALTTVPGKIGQHYEIWKPFMEYLLNKLITMNTGIIYVFMGSAAKDWARKIPETNYKLFCYHPASAVYNPGGQWDSNDVFNRINQILESNNGLKITW